MLVWVWFIKCPSGKPNPCWRQNSLKRRVLLQDLLKPTKLCFTNEGTRVLDIHHLVAATQWIQRWVTRTCGTRIPSLTARVLAPGMNFFGESYSFFYYLELIVWDLIYAYIYIVYTHTHAVAIEIICDSVLSYPGIFIQVIKLLSWSWKMMSVNLVTKAFSVISLRLSVFWIRHDLGFRVGIMT